MKKYLTLVFLILSLAVSAQRKQIDSLKKVVARLPDDTNKVKAMFKLAQDYIYYNPDSGIVIAQRGYNLAVSSKFDYYQRRLLLVLANLYNSEGNYAKSLLTYNSALRLAIQQHYDYGIIQAQNNLGSVYVSMGEFRRALDVLRTARNNLNAYKAKHDTVDVRFRRINIFIHNNLEEAFIGINKLDSAEWYITKGEIFQDKEHFYLMRPAFVADRGSIAERRGDIKTAFKYYREAQKVQDESQDLTTKNWTYFSFASLYKKINKPDSAIFYANKALIEAQKGKFLPDVAKASKLLSELYDEQHNSSLAYHYYKIAVQATDSLNNKDKVRAMASIDFEEKERQQEIAAANLSYQNTVRSYIFIAGLVIALILTVIFWRNSRQRQKANQLLQSQKQELEATVVKLQQTQTQLIQAEKMASLGELTAGIAHEIQNPLNFVNNFAEVSVELLDELKQEADEGNTGEVLSLTTALTENLQKITHHGKRADSIVKGMLEHSRASTGQKELTDLNKLADEYLRLAYHGLRAKDKSFNAELITVFEPDLPSIKVIPQDFGRVLLNLFNNAFYAVQQKQKVAGPGFKPTVTVTTSFPAGSSNVLITVRDNGNGIPDSVKDKIMQPFFTTKPTGEGTGLGLSLSYDIVVKGHGGTIEVDSQENNFTEFKIAIPA